MDALAELVWPPAQVPRNPVAGLQVYISGLRRVIEPPRAARTRPQVLVTTGGGYSLDRSQVTIDAADFARVAADARRVLRGAHSRVVPVLDVPADILESTLGQVEAALAQWYGEPYRDVVSTVGAISARARLESLRTSMLEDRAVAQLALGRQAEAATELGPLVMERVLDERLWTLYALALARSDRQADALEALRTVRRNLADELGVDPGPAVRELEGMLLRQDDALRVPPVIAPPARIPASPPPQPSPPAVSESVTTEVVGREFEIGVLRHQLAAPGTRIVQLVGEAGIGKSTLAAEVAAAARARGDVVCTARCPEDDGAPTLWPWVDVLSTLERQGALLAADVTGPVRELIHGNGAGSAPAAAEDPEVARFRLFAAVEEALSAAASRRRCVVVLEDLHWGDSSTVRLVAHLASSWAIGPASGELLLLLTRRPDGAALGRPGLAAALDALARHGTVRLDLGGLDLRDVTDLARRRATWVVDDTAAAMLHARTSGNPFMLVELLRLGEGALRPGEVPAGVTDVLRRRLAAMPDQTREVLETASVIGNEFNLEVVAKAATPATAIGPASHDQVDAVLDVLDPAVAAGLIIDSGGDRMAFAHALTRDAVFAGIRPAWRARKHARVADALADRRSGSPGGEVARHLLAAGPRHAARAWRAARDAGLEAERTFAVEEAAALLDDAMTAQSQDEQATPAERYELALAACRALRRAGQWDRFLVRVDQAAADAEARGAIEQLATFAVMPAEAGPWTPRAYGTDDPAAIRRMHRVLELLTSADSDLRCRVMLALGSELYFRPGTSAERQALADEGLAMARRLADPALLARISQRAALVIWRGGNAEARFALAAEAVEAAERAGDVDLLQTSIELRMSAALEAGRIDGMLADVEWATALLQDRPTVYRSVVLACLFVPWLAAQGRYPEAESRFAEAARVARDSQLPWAALALGTARVGLAVWRGDLNDPDPVLADLLAHTGQVLPAVRLLVSLRTDDMEATRDFLKTSADRLVTDDFTSLFHHALAAEAAYVTGDAGLAADAYAGLVADAGHVASAGTGIPLGPVDAFLALAASTTGNRESAGRHAQDAVALMQAWGLTACTAWFRERQARGGW